jgi:HK97 family phage prohead protease
MDKNFRAAQGRQVRQGFAELRTVGTEFALVGFAATYNSWSKDLGGFREQIAPGAFKRSIQQKADVKALFNHAPDHILGRTKSGTLTLEDSPKGLRFRCQLDRNSQKHQDIHAAVLRGDIDECSFAFTVPKGGDSWTEGIDPDTNQRISFRTLNDVDLIDCSVVTYPAYNETDAQARKQGRQILSTHGLKDAIDYLRKAARSLITPQVRAESSPIDFASHLDRCHQYAELAMSFADQARDCMYDAEDGCDDETVRASFRIARANAELACEHFATARLMHGKWTDSRKK